MNNKAWKLAILVLCLTLGILGLYYCLTESMIFPSILLFGFSIFILFEIKNTISKVFSSIEHSLAAVAVGDLTIGLKQLTLPTGIKTSLIEIINRQKTITQSQYSQKFIYETIIESVDTGILILKKNKKGAIDIFFSNEAFYELLELPKFTKWHLLEPHLVTFSKYLKPQYWKDSKDVITLAINEQEKTYSFRTFLSNLYDEDYLIINLDTLQNIIDKKEKEAWYNLMKVMSHEIMNTITPINALSNNLLYLIKEKKNQLGEDFKDIDQSVSTIHRRTQQLADFVDTYRSLAELPTPRKEPIKAQELLDLCLKTLTAPIERNKIEVFVNVNPPHLQLMADSKQMEQAIINLVTNSIYAVQKSIKPQITIKAFTQNDKNFIEIIDNGIGIPPEIKRDIFIPFFTTREGGSGIGLSLTKSIIQAHNGHLSVSSQEGETKFLITGI